MTKCISSGLINFVNQNTDIEPTDKSLAKAFDEVE